MHDYDRNPDAEGFGEILIATAFDDIAYLGNGVRVGQWITNPSHPDVRVFTNLSDAQTVVKQYAHKGKFVYLVDRAVTIERYKRVYNAHGTQT